MPTRMLTRTEADAEADVDAKATWRRKPMRTLKWTRKRMLAEAVDADADAVADRGPQSAE